MSHHLWQCIWARLKRMKMINFWQPSWQKRKRKIPAAPHLHSENGCQIGRWTLTLCRISGEGWFRLDWNGKWVNSKESINNSQWKGKPVKTLDELYSMLQQAYSERIKAYQEQRGSNPSWGNQEAGYTAQVTQILRILPLLLCGGSKQPWGTSGRIETHKRWRSCLEWLFTERALGETCARRSATR